MIQGLDHVGLMRRGCMGREEPLSKKVVNNMSLDGPSTVIFNKGCSKIQVAGSKWARREAKGARQTLVGLECQAQSSLVFP